MNRPRLTPTAAVLAAISVYVLIVGAACAAKYRSYAYEDFDLAVHAQSLHNITRGSLECSILGIPFLGNHFVLILFLIAPLYVLFPSPLLLLILQTAALAAGAWAVYGLARRSAGDRWGMGLALVYLVYPPLVAMNLYEFHPVALAACFLLYALLAYERRRGWACLAWFALAVLCQENIALVAAAFGVFALLERRPARWALPGLIGGPVFFAVAVLLVMPALNQDRIQFYRLYAHLGDSFPDVFVHLLTHPVRALAQVWHPAKLRFLNLLAAPVGYLPLLSPLGLIPALPVLAQRLLSARLSETSILFHYQAEFIPFLFFSAARGLGKLVRPGIRSRRLLAVGLLTVLPLLSILSTGIWRDVGASFRVSASEARAAELAGPVIDGTPPDRSVAASCRFLAHLANRPDVHSLHHLYHGVYTLSDVPYPMPARLDLVLIDTMDRITFLDPPAGSSDAGRALHARLAARPRDVVFNLGHFLALAPAAEGGNGAFPVDIVPASGAVDDDAPDLGFRLQDFRIEPHERPNAQTLVLFWRRTGGPAVRADALVRLSAGGTVVWQGRLAPGSRIAGPPTWPAGAVVTDRHGIVPRSGPVPDRLDLELEMIRIDAAPAPRPLSSKPH